MYSAKPAVDMSLREGLAGWSLVRRFPLCEIRIRREGMRLKIVTYHNYPLHLSLTVAGTQGFHLLWLVSVVLMSVVLRVSLCRTRRAIGPASRQCLLSAYSWDGIGDTGATGRERGSYAWELENRWWW